MSTLTSTVSLNEFIDSQKGFWETYKAKSLERTYALFLVQFAWYPKSPDLNGGLSEVKSLLGSKTSEGIEDDYRRFTASA